MLSNSKEQAVTSSHDQGRPELGAPPAGERVIALWQQSLGEVSLECAEPGQSLRPGQGTSIASAYDPAEAVTEALASSSGPTARLDEAGGCSGERGGDALEACAQTLTVAPPPGAVTSLGVGDGLDIELGDALGRGGMGVVHRAWQRSLKREVAVKTLLEERGADGARAFVEEATVAGYLDHPNIVPIHFLAERDDGAPLIAMKLVDGFTWRQLLHPSTEAERARAEAMTLSDHLRVLLSVCNAVSFAHARGILHGDLKPENVMLGDYGEVLLMDWGVAVDIQATPRGPRRARRRDEIRAPFGTPCYMAPELAEGAADKIGEWTDVYLLGAILAEIATGRPPHRGASLSAVLIAASRSEPPTLEASVPEELQQICLSAMAREPAARTASVVELRRALEHFLEHEESIKISRHAEALLARCDAALEGDEAPPEGLYSDFAEAVAGFRQAQLLWPGNTQALSSERRARLSVGRAAIARGDHGVVESQIARLDVATVEGARLRAELEGALGHQRRARRRAFALVIVAGLFAAAIAAAMLQSPGG